MRLLVCGSRNWNHRLSVEREIARLDPEVVIHGDAAGADRLAAQSQSHAGRTVVGFPADWARDGKAAGPIRNSRMLANGKPDRGLAFGDLWKRDLSRIQGVTWRTKHTGTGDMVSKMLAFGVPVRWVSAPGVEAIDLTEMPAPPAT